MFDEQGGVSMSMSSPNATVPEPDAVLDPPSLLPPVPVPPESAPATDEPGADSAAAEPGAEPGIAESGVEPAAAEPGVEPAAAEPGVEPTAAESGAEPTAAESGAEPTAAESGAEPGAADAAPAIDPAKAERERVWAEIETVKKEDGSVRGTVTEVVKGGLILDIGVRGFLPASLVEMRRVRDLAPYVGRELEAKVIELDRHRNNVVLSRRAWLEKNRTQSRTGLLDQLQRGQIRRGVVSSIVNFGVFVDLGGVDGLVHVSELSWRHIDHPSEVVQVGQEVEVEVLEIDQTRQRVSLSLKATQEDPWRHFARAHAISQIIPGTVTKLVPFGAFVRVDDGIEGLVHISELAEGHIDAPEQVVQAGDQVFVKVVDIDLERRRISLSLKQANADFSEEGFDPTLYGMAATYDNDGNYIYPEGFDSESGEWRDGFEREREEWEREYAEAHDRWEAHGRQVQAGRAAGP